MHLTVEQTKPQIEYQIDEYNINANRLTNRHNYLFAKQTVNFISNFI